MWTNNKPLPEGTKFKLYPQPPFLEEYEEPETVYVSSPAGTVGVGPSDERMSLPAGLTDLSGEDPYRKFAEPSALLRLPELLELCDVIASLRDRIESSSSTLVTKNEI